MKKLTALVLLAALVLGTPALAQGPFKGEVVLGPGLGSPPQTEYFQNWDRTLSPDTLYTLTGLYYVTNGHTINIPAGCYIQGENAATLIVQTGGTIIAEGTQEEPIVMTSMNPPGSRARGDWGGVVLLGLAPVNKENPIIEGGIISGSYGGDNPMDSSGIFKYVRIEFPGYRFQLNNEINGLTMGGVGRGTELHHVQVSYSFDDGFEWFGGTVDARYLVAFGCTDDDFDSDFGWTGRVQFGFGIKDPLIWDTEGETRGFESDNDGTGSQDQPISQPIFNNMTEIGPWRGPCNDEFFFPGHRFDWEIVTRRCSRQSVFNTVFAGWPKGASIRDACSQDDLVNGLAQIRNVSFAAANEAEAGSNCIHDTGRWPDVCTVLATPAWNNLGHVPSNDTDNCRWGDLNFVDLTNMNDPQPVPAPGSELIGSADQTWAMLSANSDFFDLTPNYRGAFAPGVPMEEQWTAGWTNFDPQNQYYLTPVRESGDDLPSVGTYSSVYPNPFNPSTVIKFSVPTSGQVTLKVYDMRGQEVATLVDEIMEVGSFERPFFAVDLPSGTYFYRLSGNGFSDTGKMQLVK